MTSQSPGRVVLQSSSNYIWSTAEVLGKGATATVYLGRHKETGDQAAIKVFSERVSRFFSGICSRELEVLRKINHKNVIVLYAIETESVSQNEILVVEYCAGGSLYQMLDQPENAFGFEEEEFLIVLTHIVNGMEYLRQQGLIHRDIKPGNIMRHIGDDGRSIYKLTDFGAARELEDDDTFTSIFGTEEYLHPGMYEKAVLRHQTGQRFDSSVDLWSIGVTLYHVATGHLPFQPYGGRSNTQTMFQITSEKESGVLSGVQFEENGPIVWSSEMPSTCLLSNSLKTIITPMLAGLMESNITKRLDFTKLFQIVHNIEDMIRLNVFFCQAGQNLVVYISKQDNYSSLQEKLALLTEFPAREQLILVWDRELSDIIEMTTQIQNYPTAILHGRLFLYRREKPEKQRLLHPTMSSFPDFSNSSNEKPKHTAKKCLGVAYHLERVTTGMIKNQHCSTEAETTLRTHVRRRISHLQSCMPDLTAILDGTRDRQKTFYSLMEKIVLLLTFLRDETISEYIRKLQNVLNDKAIRAIMEKADNRCDEIREYMRILTEKVMEQEAVAISSRVGCQEEDHCLSKIAHFRKNIGYIWEKFCQEKNPSGQSSFDNFLYTSERSKLQEYCIKLQSFTIDHCLANSYDTYNDTYRQFELLTKNLQRTKKVEQNLSHVMDCMKQLCERLDKIQSDSLETISVASTCLQRTKTEEMSKPQAAQGDNMELSIKLESQKKEMTKLQHLVQSNTVSLEKLLKSMDSTIFSPENSWNLVRPSSVVTKPTVESVNNSDSACSGPVAQGSEQNAASLDVRNWEPDGSDHVSTFPKESPNQAVTEELLDVRKMAPDCQIKLPTQEVSKYNVIKP